MVNWNTEWLGLAGFAICSRLARPFAMRRFAPSFYSSQVRVWPPHPGPLPLGGGEGEPIGPRLGGAAPSLAPSEGERAGVRGPLRQLVVLTRCAQPATATHFWLVLA